MSATAPEDPEQIRGETLTPVSPKPQYYPSPSNIPILEASMDPTFSDTVTQSMQQHEQPPAEPLPSVASHTIPIVVDSEAVQTSTSDNVAPADETMADESAETITADNDNAPASTSGPELFVPETAIQAPEVAIPDTSSGSFEADWSEDNEKPSTAVDAFLSVVDASVDTAATTTTEGKHDTSQDQPQTAQVPALTMSTIAPLRTRTPPPLIPTPPIVPIPRTAHPR